MNNEDTRTVAFNAEWDYNHYKMSLHKTENKGTPNSKNSREVPLGKRACKIGYRERTLFGSVTKE